ncbi:hypothetical protein [Micromonospora peucetia]|uniref:Uncharacterized protein n=1 Tax=Micromonospora peucetia TaxID=47871 RepID=A0A1C6UUG4_9ACTN|nr:hypothetical protein [Micromonospora peucetia]WSA34817.1 hypothetical protein OIE14_12610 [Micromonospora peucetia]SCL57459.1 hypothetical protein GA0070608_1827 [Micromonospora peucetia]
MTPPADAPVRPPRPVTVTIAFWLQLVAVLALLALVALLVTQAIQWDGQIDRAVRAVPDADPDEVRGERWINVTMTVVVGLPTLLLALWLAATAVPVRRGGNTARIMVFVAGGLQLAVCLCQGLFGALVFPLFFVLGFEEGPYVEGEYPDGDSAAPEADIWAESKFSEALYAGPDTFDAVLFPLAGVGVLTVLLLTFAVVLLLALPPANRWFVPRTESLAVPPTAYPVFPVAYAPSLTPGGYRVAPPGYLICPDPAAHQPPPPGPGTSETGPAEG